jgi:hypothetical protein
MTLREPLQNSFSLGGYFEYYSSSVLWIGGAEQQSCFHRAVYQLNGAVVVQAQTRGGISDADGHARRRPCHLKQQLMLLRVQTDSIRRLLAELQEPAQLISKLGKDLQEVAIGAILVHPFLFSYIVSRHICFVHDRLRRRIKWKEVSRDSKGLIKGLRGSTLK